VASMFRIAKKDTRTGRTIRSMPVLYDDQSSAQADAQILNSSKRIIESPNEFVVAKLAEPVQSPAGEAPPASQAKRPPTFFEMIAAPDFDLEPDEVPSQDNSSKGVWHFQ